MQTQYHRASGPIKSGDQTGFSVEVFLKDRNPTFWRVIECLTETGTQQ
jgi:hypothetical protein